MSARGELVPVKPNHRFDEERRACYLRKELASLCVVTGCVCDMNLS